jgi:Alw26I/Eco31I/Esp3I family type II restriction endonuclease
MMQENSKAGKHPAFVAYMKAIACHPNYAGMPDLINAKGEIQWEAPSNRRAGQFRDTHHKRRDWWRAKAKELGINTDANQWISQAAKLLHPTKKKPCSVCGKEMDIRYIYPSKQLAARVRALPFVPIDYLIPPDADVFSLIRNLYVDFGTQVTSALPAVFGVILPKQANNPEAVISWIESELVPRETRLLSPGVMSNAPDRLDGFHTFNRCCRHTADKGRHASNLKTYVTDRRVFEYWSAGDWIAANELMGLIRSKFGDEPCLHGHSGPCTCDHVGPISLGFCHRASFRLLCHACNSARNNRMTLADVQSLILEESLGKSVISWHSQALWNARKFSVVDNETALRLSKQLRDNRHALMYALDAIAQEGHYAFLSLFLELDRAEYEVGFQNLRIENSVTVFDNEIRKARLTKYSDEQKARRIRIAFAELYSYHAKANRNVFFIQTPEAASALEKCLSISSHKNGAVAELDSELKQILALPDSEALLRQALEKLSGIKPESFANARETLQSFMDICGHAIAADWENLRYVRTEIAGSTELED